MTTLSELSKAFSVYRRRCGHKSGQIKYPLQLKEAVRRFVSNHPAVRSETIADAIKVSNWSVRHWCGKQPRKGSFIPVEVKEVPTQKVLTRGAQISSGDITISIGCDTSREDVEKIIKLLLVG